MPKHLDQLGDGFPMAPSVDAGEQEAAGKWALRAGESGTGVKSADVY